VKNELVLKQCSCKLILAVSTCTSSHLKVTLVSEMEFLDLLENNLEQISKCYDKVTFNETKCSFIIHPLLCMRLRSVS